MIFVGIAAVALAIVIVVFVATGGEDTETSGTTGDTVASGTSGNEAVQEPAENEGESPPPPAGEKAEPRENDAGPRWRYIDEHLGDRQKFVKEAPWNPPRPLRFVVRYGEKQPGRTSSQAQKRAEDVRRRFLDGESPYGLIRELSDPPRGIPSKLIKQYESLPEGEASPVIPLESGFAVFFGTPSKRPGPSKATAGQPDAAAASGEGETD